MSITFVTTTSSPSSCPQMSRAVLLVLVAVGALGRGASGQSNYASQGNSVEYEPNSGLPDQATLNGRVSSVAHRGLVDFRGISLPPLPRCSHDARIGPGCGEAAASAPLCCLPFPCRKDWTGAALHSTLSSSVQVTKLDDLSPVIFLNRTKAVLNCEAGSMKAELKFNEPFFGIVYADFDRNSACQVAGKGALSYRIELPLKGCGTRQVSAGPLLPPQFSQPPPPPPSET